MVDLFFCWSFAFTSNASLLLPFFFMTHFYPCRQKIVKKYGVIECDPLILTGLDGTVSQNKTSFSF